MTRFLNAQKHIHARALNSLCTCCMCPYVEEVYSIAMQTLRKVDRSSTGATRILQIEIFNQKAALIHKKSVHWDRLPSEQPLSLCVCKWSWYAD